MEVNAKDWKQALVHLAALAAHLEGQGQYNVAKQARAAIDSILRSEAYQAAMPDDLEGLSQQVKLAIDGLEKIGLDNSLLNTLRSGAAALAEGRLTFFEETPDPYVCRTCGCVSMQAPQSNCPNCGAWAGTFQHFPPVYWLEALDPFEALPALRRTPQAVASLFKGLSPEALELRPESGGWAIRNVVSHLRDAQEVLSFRVDLMLEQENPVLESLAVFEWAGRDLGLSAWEIFEIYNSSRQVLIARLESISLVDWWRSGKHAEFGPVTVCKQVSYFAIHEMTHLPQIEALRLLAS